MPKRTDISSILIIGSGPIVIGQACEFDYSGAQACKALKAEGYRVVLVNSNPATIMTDPEMADATYVEPLTVELLEKIIAEERPDALLPTVGGQTGLNLAVALAEQGVLDTARCGADRGESAGDAGGGGPGPVQAGDDGGGVGVAAQPHCAYAGGGAGDFRDGDWALPHIHPPQFYAWAAAARVRFLRRRSSTRRCRGGCARAR